MTDRKILLIILLVIVVILGALVFYAQSFPPFDPLPKGYPTGYPPGLED